MTLCISICSIYTTNISNLSHTHTPMRANYTSRIQGSIWTPMVIYVICGYTCHCRVSLFLAVLLLCNVSISLHLVTPQYLLPISLPQDTCCPILIGSPHDTCCPSHYPALQTVKSRSPRMYAATSCFLAIHSASSCYPIFIAQLTPTMHATPSRYPHDTCCSTLYPKMHAAQHCYPAIHAATFILSRYMLPHLVTPQYMLLHPVTQFTPRCILLHLVILRPMLPIVTPTIHAAIHLVTP